MALKKHFLDCGQCNWYLSVCTPRETLYCVVTFVWYKMFNTRMETTALSVNA